MEHEFYLHLIRDTDKAFLFTDGVEEYWLPKSQVEVTLVKDKDYEVLVPEWLAKEKELI
jgi:hypothetical protein